MTTEAVPDRVVDRIGKLLAQAEGTDNEHEASAFVERAQRLATEHAVDLERARARQRDAQGRRSVQTLEQDRVEVGPRGRRGNRNRVLLYVAVARANDVLVNVAGDSSYVLGFGHRSDLDVVERLWASLAVQMVSGAQRRLDGGEHRRSGVAALSWRLSFYDGFIATVAQRLWEARERVAAQPPPSAGEPSAALVLRDKAEQVQEFYASASQARGTWRGAGGRTQYSGDAWESGSADGARADLGRSRLRQRGQLGG